AFSGITENDTKSRPSASLLSHIECAARPERCCILTVYFTTVLQREARAIHPAIKCLDNRKGRVKDIALIAVFHGRQGADLPFAARFRQRMSKVLIAEVHDGGVLGRVEDRAAVGDGLAQLLPGLLGLLFAKFFIATLKGFFGKRLEVRVIRRGIDAP